MPLFFCARAPPADNRRAKDFTVALASPLDDATATVTVTLASSDTGAVTVDTDASVDGDQLTLTFTASDWNTAQNVTATAVEDLDGADETVTVSLTASGDKYGGVTGTMTVDVTDDEEPALTIIPNELEVDEGSVGESFTVALAVPPTTTVTVKVDSEDTEIATVSPPQLTFTTLNWDTAQTVTVTAKDDDDGADEEGLKVLLEASGAEYDFVTSEVEVDVDDDEPGLKIEHAPLALVEGGSTGSFDVSLESEPTTTVTVSVTSDDTGAATVDTDSAVSGLQSTLTFTTANWSTAQTVTVTSVQDPDGANETVTVTLDASGAEYDDEDGTVTVEVDDDETPALTISDSPVSLTEGGATGTFTVVLDVQPKSGNVTVTVESDDIGAVTVSPGSLTFTTADWDTPQTVTVSAVQDDDGAAESVDVKLEANGDGYVEVEGEAEVNVADDETPALTISKEQPDNDRGRVGGNLHGGSGCSAEIGQRHGHG